MVYESFVSKKQPNINSKDLIIRVLIHTYTHTYTTLLDIKKDQTNFLSKII